MKKFLAALSLLGALLVPGLVPVPSAHADAPQVGQSCNDPSALIIDYRHQPPSFVVCAGHQWQDIGPYPLSTPRVFTIGAPCGQVSVDYHVIGMENPLPGPMPDSSRPGGWGTYLAMCYQGKWTPYRP